MEYKVSPQSHNSNNLVAISTQKGISGNFCIQEESYENLVEFKTKEGHIEKVDLWPGGRLNNCASDYRPKNRPILPVNSAMAPLGFSSATSTICQGGSNTCPPHVSGNCPTNFGTG